MHSLMTSAKGFAKMAMTSFLTFKTASAVHKALEDGVLTDAECVDIATATLSLIGQGNPIKHAITLFFARQEAFSKDGLGGNGNSLDDSLGGNRGSQDDCSGCNGGSSDDCLDGNGSLWDGDNVLEGNDVENPLVTAGQDNVDDIIKGLVF
jgi:hypothetical protein